MKALRRREPSVLDVLVKCLKKEEAVNTDLIRSIREGRWCLIPVSPPHSPSPPLVFPERPHPPPPTSVNLTLPISDDWPAPMATPPSSHPSIPPPPTVRQPLYGV